MTVRGPALDPRCRGGHPVWSSSGRQQSCSWIDRQGRPTSPPPLYPPRDSRYGPRTRKVELCIEPGQSLGLMIRGGLEYGLGIYVTGVDKDSVADRAGLLVRVSQILFLPSMPWIRCIFIRLGFSMCQRTIFSVIKLKSFSFFYSLPCWYREWSNRVGIF